jgi:hypothetical protein
LPRVEALALLSFEQQHLAAAIASQAGILAKQSLPPLQVIAINLSRDYAIANRHCFMEKWHKIVTLGSKLAMLVAQGFIDMNYVLGELAFSSVYRALLSPY